jgi:outer membrane lipoprotein LolB
LRPAAGALALLLAGCATLPPAPAGDWPARRAALQALEQWALFGRVAVARGADGFSGGVQWRQQGTVAEIDVRGPLGAGAIAIRQDGDTLVVTDADGRNLDGEAAREATAAYVGAPLPLAELRYWLLGIPAPGSPFSETLDATQQLSALEQAGWQVRYERYALQDGIRLPTRMELKAGTVRLRFVVSSWRLAR